MKKYWMILLLSLAAVVGRADTLVLWDFDFPAVPVGTFGGGDNQPLTGTFVPNGGSGSLTNIGTTTNSFGAPPSGSTATSDTDVGDNSALRLGQFPANNTNNNLTAGIQVFSSTVGFENIVVTYDQENSASASKYWRFQYTTNGGTTWINSVSYTATSTAWVQGHSVDLSGAAGVRNNASFGFRIVSECMFSATGSGTTAFVGQAGTTASYSTVGTLWLDMVKVSGTAVTPNTPPTITAIADQNVAANSGPLGPISFTIGDAETPVTALTVAASSSNPTLVSAPGDTVLGGTGASRTVTVTPEPNQFGTAQITVTVTDGNGATASSVFNLIVRQPALVISNATERAGGSTNVTLQVTDSTSFLGTVTVSADSANTALLIDNNISITGSGSSYTISFNPTPGQTGVTLISLTATDGSLTTTNSFYFRVVPTNTVTLWDFNSKVLDNDATSGSLVPIIGTGTATVCGTSTNIVTSLASTDFDPETADNSKWRIASFAAQGTGDATSGIELHLDTTGYQNISLSMDQYNSASSSRYYAVLYTLDGVNYSTLTTYSNTLLTTFYLQTVSFGAIAGANNNPNFGVRIVGTFEGSATGNGNANYVANQPGGYSTGGTLWLDDIGFTGDPYVVGGNTPPVISSIPDQSTAANVSAGPFSFTVGDAQTAANLLTVTATSSNPTLVSAPGDIALGGSGASRTVTINPELNQTGTALITLIVTDGSGATSSTSFNVTVSAPVISVANITARLGTPTSAQINVASFLGTLNITADSANTTLLTDPNIAVSGSGTTRTLTFSTAAGQTGATLISLSVTDGTFTATNSFYLHIVPANTIALWDFNSSLFDSNPNTGIITPAIGSGSVLSAGGTTNSLNSNVAAVDFDPEQADNSKWRIGAFPAPATADETGGVEFRASTVGYQNIHLSFDQYNSSTASQFWQIQYSLNGTTFVNFGGYTNTVVTTWGTSNIDFSSIAGANNNAHFAVRVVAEFQSTATGSGPANYLGVGGGAYGSAGTLWLDDINFTGDAISAGPVLTVTSVGNVINVAWPTSATSAVLQSSPSLSPSAWANVSQAATMQGTNNVVSYTNVTGAQFFRLVH